MLFYYEITISVTKIHVQINVIYKTCVLMTENLNSTTRDLRFCVESEALPRFGHPNSHPEV